MGSMSRSTPSKPQVVRTSTTLLTRVARVPDWIAVAKEVLPAPPIEKRTGRPAAWPPLTTAVMRSGAKVS